jgi:hypothetical protein
VIDLFFFSITIKPWRRYNAGMDYPKGTMDFLRKLQPMTAEAIFSQYGMSRMDHARVLKVRRDPHALSMLSITPADAHTGLSDNSMTPFRR